MTDGRNFYDQSIDDLIKQYDEVRKVTTGQGDDYTRACLLDYVNFKDNYTPIAVDSSKQNVFDADSRAIQQIIFQGKSGQKLRQYTVLEKIKRNLRLRILQRNSKSALRIYKWLNTIK